MTWDQLMGKIREGLTESGAYVRAAGDSLTEAIEGDGVLNGGKTVATFMFLALAVSDLHSTVEHMAIGLDAVVETLCEVAESQEVEGE